MNSGKLKIAILTASDSEATCLSISKILALPNVEICGILLDVDKPRFKQRLRNLRRNIRREGPLYIWYRLGEAVLEKIDSWAELGISSGAVKKLLKESFPGRVFELADFSRVHNIPLFQVPNLNSQKAIEVLARLGADLGVVLGTRILKRSTYSVPRLGSLNLHKGQVPEYRGQPVGFWELYDGQATAGVTVHFVDDGLDTGDVLGEASIAIHHLDTPHTLRRKLDLLGADLLARCISDVATGVAVGRKQPKSTCKPHTSPTRRERRTLDKKLKLYGAPQARWLHFLKSVWYLAIFYLGFYHLARTWRRRFSGGRACILLYHRVNNLLLDPLTTSLERFAAHLLIFQRYYPIRATSEILKRSGIQNEKPGSVVAIHFDDCYRDVFTNAAPLLKRCGDPALAFVSSGFVDSDRIFAHDAAKCPVQLENLKAAEVVSLTNYGFEIGSHTVNHVDLGVVSAAEASAELVQSKQELETLLGRPVTLVSFPYGRKRNIRPEVVNIARQAGYAGMFSAHGGFVDGHADPFDLPRVGVSGMHRPLDVLMEIEGLSLGALKRLFLGPQDEE